MSDAILDQIRKLYDRPFIQNNLRGLWAEVMIAELLNDRWRHVGVDWGAWDLEREDGLRLEVKQSSRQQSWGPSRSAPRFSIAAAKGYYPDGLTYTPINDGKRLADIYVFAWHDGKDQRIPSEWEFYPIAASRLPTNQKSIGLTSVARLTEPVTSEELSDYVEGLGKAISPIPRPIG